MSGAQPKAGTIAGVVSVTAEVNEEALMKRYTQGWVSEVVRDLEVLVERIKTARQAKECVSIAFLGNVVAVWERLAAEDSLIVDLGTDQTSLHNPYGGGYYPVQLDFAAARAMIASDPERFKVLVQESLRRQVAAINKLTAKGMRFWDYGNAFLLEASRAGADITLPNAPAGHFRCVLRFAPAVIAGAWALGTGAVVACASTAGCGCVV